MRGRVTKGPSRVRTPGATQRGHPGALGPERPVVAGVPISNPGRVVFPEAGLTKLELARYYLSIGRWIVPHVAGRPLTLVHCPGGVAEPCRYMKHAKVWGPAVLRRVQIQEKTKTGEYLVADDIAGVVALAQMGIVEIHTWNSTIADLERPDRIVWDLDPGEALGWEEIAAAARLLRDVLETLGLAAWIKTTGGVGLHVVVPIVPDRDWSECLAFARRVSEALVRAYSDRFTISYSKRGREAKILLDYLRNNRTNTSVCAYSPRARGGAPVSVPIDWRELREAPVRWDVAAVRERLQRRRADPWSGYWRSEQRLTDRAIEAIASI